MYKRKAIASVLCLLLLLGGCSTKQAQTTVPAQTTQTAQTTAQTEQATTQTDPVAVQYTDVQLQAGIFGTNNWLDFSLLSGAASFALQVPESWEGESGIYSRPYEGGTLKVMEFTGLVQLKDGQTVLDNFDLLMHQEGEVSYGEIRQGVTARGYPYSLLIGLTVPDGGASFGSWYPFTYYIEGESGVAVMTFYVLDPASAEELDVIERVTDTITFGEVTA